MAKITGLCVGESLVGEVPWKVPNEHITLVLTRPHNPAPAVSIGFR